MQANITFIDNITGKAIHSIQECLCDEEEFKAGRIIQIKGEDYLVEGSKLIINGHKQYKVYVQKKGHYN